MQDAEKWALERFPSLVGIHPDCGYDHIDNEQLFALLAEYASSSNAALLKEVAHQKANYAELKREAESKVSALEGQMREAQAGYVPQEIAQDMLRMLQSIEAILPGRGNTLLGLTQRAVAHVERLQEALRDAIGAKDGWRIRAGKVLGDP